MEVTFNTECTWC